MRRPGQLRSPATPFRARPTLQGLALTIGKQRAVEHQREIDRAAGDMGPRPFTDAMVAYSAAADAAGCGCRLTSFDPDLDTALLFRCRPRLLEMIVGYPLTLAGA